MLKDEVAEAAQATEAAAEYRAVSWSKWTPALVTDLRAMWKEGLSASEIAVAIRVKGGPRFSRNAVIGKLHRLGLNAASVPGFKSQLKSKRGASRQASSAKKRRSGSYSPVEAGSTKRIVVRRMGPKMEPSTIKDLPPDRAPLVASVAQLESHHCRWPIGDPRQPGFGFCGCTRVDGSSYCADHADRAVSNRPVAPLHIDAGRVVRLGVNKLISAEEFTAP